MAYNTRSTGLLIKFVRGTTEQFNQITKQDDTLYFIYENENAETGKLYLGDKLIGGGSLTELTDLIEGNSNDGDLLVYDESSQKWVSEPVSTAIRIVSGASASTDGQSGLVPTPKVGDQNKFLRGDGTWASISAGITPVDVVTLDYNANDELTIKGFDSAAVGSIPQKTATGFQWIPITSLSAGLSYKKVTTLAEVTDSGFIYLVPNSVSGTNNIFDEYMVIDNHPELIGSVGHIDLSGYVTTSTFDSTIDGLEAVVANKVGYEEFNTLSNTVNNINERLTWQEIYNE